MQRKLYHLGLAAALCSSVLLAGCSRMQPDGAGAKSVIRTNDTTLEETSWGSLQFLVTGADGTSQNMTVARATWKPGQANSSHHHPNCEEILYVVAGRLEHTLPEGGTAVLNPGDTVVLPRGSSHYAKNVGSEEAVAIVVFDSAYRKVVGE